MENTFHPVDSHELRVMEPTAVRFDYRAARGL
jgi:hypothetical protein